MNKIHALRIVYGRRGFLPSYMSDQVQVTLNTYLK